jgi:diguanylate cyclase (GGDEF)-like protein/PAS domain S-box-containing protein
MKPDFSPAAALGLIRSLQAELREKNAQLRTLMEALPDRVAFVDEQGQFQACNRAFSSSHGLTEQEVRGRQESELNRQGLEAEPGAGEARAAAYRGIERSQRWFEAADGSMRFLDTQRMRVRDPQGHSLGAVIVSRDITERRRLREQLAERERRLLMALQGASLGVWDWDIGSGRMNFSPLFAEMLGHEQAELRPHVSTLEELVHEEDWEAIKRVLEPHLRGESASYAVEYRLQHKQGHWVWLHDAGRVLERDETGRPLRVVGLHQDITARKRMEESLLHLATSDPLTGLWNRRHFTQMVNGELHRVRRHQQLAAALLILDLDHFKRINDTWGHAVGDEVLKHFSGLVSQHLREIDVFARLGGEEFGVLLPGLEDSRGALRAANRLRDLLAEHPVMLDSGPLAFTASIGVAMLEASDSGFDSVFARADAALYEAKNTGRNRAVLAGAGTAATVTAVEAPVASAAKEEPPANSAAASA